MVRVHQSFNGSLMFLSARRSFLVVWTTVTHCCIKKIEIESAQKASASVGAVHHVLLLAPVALTSFWTTSAVQSRMPGASVHR